MSLSKDINKALEGVSCADIFHPDVNCWNFFWNNIQLMIPSYGKFSVPIIFVNNEMTK